MSSPASIAKHPIHPMLVVFPLGLWNFSLAADIISRVKGNDPGWKDVAAKTMGGGIVTALLAAVPGFIDFLSLSGRRRKIALAHMLLNLGAVGLYSYNLFRRSRGTPDGSTPISLSILGSAGLFVSGWLGGELVYVEATAVEPQREEETPQIEIYTGMEGERQIIR